MKKAVKIISLVLCLCLLFSACSGEKGNEENSSDEEINTSLQNSETDNDGFNGNVALPYNKTDGLNPFFARSYENLYICSLMYQPLYSVDSGYSVNTVIAENLNVTDNTAMVRIRQGVSFKDASYITADDVVYSFNMAKESYAWAESLNEIVSAQAVGRYAVEFTLTHKDIYVAGKLNFPVVKAGTADTEDMIPMGSGNYYYVEDKLINTLNNKKILSLVSIGTRDSVENAMTIDAVDVFFNDMSNCNYTTTTATMQDVQLNNMVYLGLNSANGALNNTIRNAIAARLDSDKIALSSYQGHATAMKLPFNPQSGLANEVTAIKTAGDKELANKIIDRCGYTRYSGSAKTNGAYTLALSIIVNKDNKFRVAAAYNIADALNECGFLISVQSLPFDEYVQRIESGNFDMYLGEVKLDYTMDIGQFFNQNSMLSAGIDVDSEVATEYFRFRAGEITPAEYYEVFVEQYPFVPIVFRKGYVLTSDELKLNLKEIPYSLYSGL